MNLKTPFRPGTEKRNGKIEVFSDAVKDRLQSGGFMPPFFVGIDPGKKGGVSIIDAKQRVLFCEEMPVKKEEIDIVEIHVVLKTVASIYEVWAIIEKSQSMPGQGVVAVFTYGKTYGSLLTALILSGAFVSEIHPVKWKKAFDLIHKTKLDSVELASKLFPAETFITLRGRIKDGKAESIILAEHARRVYLSNNALKEIK